MDWLKKGGTANNTQQQEVVNTLIQKVAQKIKEENPDKSDEEIVEQAQQTVKEGINPDDGSIIGSSELAGYIGKIQKELAQKAKNGAKLKYISKLKNVKKQPEKQKEKTEEPKEMKKGAKVQKRCKCGCAMKISKNKDGGLVEACSCGCKPKKKQDGGTMEGKGVTVNPNIGKTKSSKSNLKKK